MTNKSELIKKELKEVGFDLIGFTKPELDQNLIKNFIKRHNNDDLPPFVHHDIESILNPKSFVPFAESVIVLGLSYAWDDNDNSDGYISYYTRGEDYHNVFQEKMEKAVSVLKNFYKDLKFSYFVDNAPVLEKVFAQQAGLGWIGKNTLLINENLGSYLFLGEIFINKKLKYDNKAENKCGSCTACIDNCPTGSLNTPYYLNYRTCRSSLTQVKGILDKTQESLIGNSIWGCDRCQDVCPYNKDIPKKLHKELKPKIKGNITKILNYNKKSFPKKWLNSALSWRGMRTIQRNALIALINNEKKDEKYKKVLIKKINDNSPIIRYYAFKAYISLGFNLDDIKEMIENESEIDIENILKEEVR
ncbi:MAG: tRNA epoxyqueuosine(34) reductase QueG [Halanaerobiales bacterium]|nr:tRNA epoxyqueuosine(34) reductase QueG [Halanaerobiales bacterium]